MPFDSRNRDEHYAVLKTRLESLRELISANSDFNERLGLFGECLEHREYGLALETICDFLLEPNVRPVTDIELEEITALHRLMVVDDRCVLRLQKKRQELQKSNGRQ